MAKDSLEDNDVLINAFGRNKSAIDVANNMAGRMSKDNIQKVVAALEAQGQHFTGKLGNMETSPKARVAKPKPVVVDSPEPEISTS